MNSPQGDPLKRSSGSRQKKGRAEGGNDMQMDRFTYKAQEALSEAQKTAERYNHQQIDTGHILLSLIKQREGIVPQLLKRLEIDLTALEKEVHREMERIPRVTGPGSAGQIYITPGLKGVFDMAEKEAEQMHDEYVSTEHIFIAATGGDDATAKILKNLGATKDRILKGLAEIRGAQRVT